MAGHERICSGCSVLSGSCHLPPGLSQKTRGAGLGWPRLAGPRRIGETKALPRDRAAAPSSASSAKIKHGPPTRLGLLANREILRFHAGCLRLSRVRFVLGRITPAASEPGGRPPQPALWGEASASSIQRASVHKGTPRTPLPQAPQAAEQRFFDDDAPLSIFWLFLLSSFRRQAATATTMLAPPRTTTPLPAD